MGQLNSISTCYWYGDVLVLQHVLYILILLKGNSCIFISFIQNGPNDFVVVEMGWLLFSGLKVSEKPFSLAYTIGKHI